VQEEGEAGGVKLFLCFSTLMSRSELARQDLKSLISSRHPQTPVPPVI
jgi:hypothetical protein